MQAIALVLAWHSARWTPALSFSLPLFRSMAAFGARVSAAEFIAASRAWAEAAIVASMLGASALGYLNIAQRLVAIVQELSAAAIMPVSIVVFARIRDTTERLRRGYLRALSVGYAAVTPLLTVVAVTAPALIPLLFGDQWDASVPLAQALAIAAILTLGAMLDQGLLYGVGRPGTWLRYAVAIDALTVAVTAVAVHRGLTAVAVGFVAVALVATAARWIMVSRIVESPVTVIARPLLITATTAAVSGGLGTVVFAAFSADAPLLVQVAVTAVVVGLASLVLVRLCQRGVASYALQIMPVPVSVKTVARRLLALPSSDPVRAA
jgi:O-antigen/teichoic acid export membrane protein